MNSVQISIILSSNPYTKKAFIGCFPCDKIPAPVKFPFLAIVNTDRSGQIGTHWILIYAKSRSEIEQFDPLGNKPDGYILRFLKNFDSIKYTNLPVQQKWSHACGIYVLLYAIFRCKGQSRLKTLSSLAQLPPFLIEQLLP